MNISDLESYDWRCVFEYAGDIGNIDVDGDPVWEHGIPRIGACIGTDTDKSPVRRRDVKRIVAFVEGENEGPSWCIVVELNDGRFAFVEAGCDYTGWDCQAGGSCIVDTDLEHLKLMGIPQADVVRMRWL